jgi:hypothetical protein
MDDTTPKHVQSEAPLRPQVGIQPQPPPPKTGDSVPMPEYDFRRRSGGLMGSRLGLWQTGLCFAILLVSVAGVYLILCCIPSSSLPTMPTKTSLPPAPATKPLLVVAKGRETDPAPPPLLTAEEARQALVEFSANDPRMARFPAARRAVPNQLSEKRVGKVVFGGYSCDLASRMFKFVDAQAQMGSDEVYGEFVIENRVWKARFLGGPGDGK